MNARYIFVFGLSILFISELSGQASINPDSSNKKLCSLQNQFFDKLNNRIVLFAQSHFDDYTFKLIENSTIFDIKDTTDTIDPITLLEPKYRSLAKEVYQNVYYDIGYYYFLKTHFITFWVSGKSYLIPFSFTLDEVKSSSDPMISFGPNRIDELSSKLGKDIIIKDLDNLILYYRVTKGMLMDESRQKIIINDLGKKVMKYVYNGNLEDLIFLESHFLTFRFIRDGEDNPFKEYNIPLTGFLADDIAQPARL